ncbi:hypothetical protein AVEN_57051-1 [Araneus ventricosus]|uniref:Uncharacterized protein n=1 Tax=Araneus ventricosus TaxID=182803 RepID=A0A4Y2N8N2_ARAVE|nr:hypothetical protein AVEN_57051-1 [Araneus ventricosus]
MVEAEFQANFEAPRKELRKHAKQQIFKIQEENRKTYNLRRREPKPETVRDLVAIKITQFGPHLKLKPKYFGAYSITREKGGNTYDVIIEGNHEGPNFTTCAEYLKPWNTMSELYYHELFFIFQNFVIFDFCCVPFSFCFACIIAVCRTSRIQEDQDCGARLTAALVIPANCVAHLADPTRTPQ